MISEAFAKKQLMRLSGLDYFPKETAAITELWLAVRAAENEGIAESVISEWLAMVREAPKPADLRRLIHDKNATIQRGSCSLCCGSYFVTAWVLVNYREDEFTIDRAKGSRRLLNFDAEQAIEFGKKLGANQGILTAAVPCRCMPATHLARGNQDQEEAA